LFARLIRIRDRVSRRIVIVYRSLLYTFHVSPGLAILSLLISLVSGTAPVVELWFLKEILNSISFGGNRISAVAAPYVVFVVGLFFARFLIMVTEGLGQFIQRILSEVVANRSKLDVLQAISQLDYDVFEDPEHHDKMSRVSQSASRDQASFLNESFFTLTAAINVVAVFFILSTFGVYAAIILLVATLPFAYARLRGEWALWGHRVRHTEMLREVDYYDQIVTSREFSGEVRVYRLAEELMNRRNKLWSTFYAFYTFGLTRMAMWMLVSIVPALIAVGYLYWSMTSRVWHHTLLIGNIALAIGAVQQMQSALFTTFIFAAQWVQRMLPLNELFEAIL